MVHSALIAVVVILLCAHLCGALAQWLRQPRVIGEMAGGILLGPSVLGAALPQAQQAVLPPAVLPLLDVLGQLGVTFFMFAVGMEMDLRRFRRGAGRTALVVGQAGVAIPFALGVAAGLVLPGRFQPDASQRLPFLMFLGLSLAVSALPVLASILRQRGLLDTPIGSLGMATAAVGDVTVWCLLVLLIGLSSGGGSASAAWTAGLAVLFVTAMIVVVGPLVRRALAWAEARPREPHTIMAFLTLYVLLCALSGELIGIHPAIGALLAGVVMPKNSLVADDFVRRCEGVTLWLLLPLFFTVTGLRTHLSAVAGPVELAVCALLLVAAVAGKLGGAALAARLSGLPGREAFALGAMLNCRGLTELVILSIGLSQGLITETLFPIMIVVTLVTTAATAPLLDRLVPSPGAAGRAERGPGQPAEVAGADARGMGTST
ncbi:hypothetical protein Sme01_31420 [Sphaerisporangium melleum]|uniref:Cation/H+ exchanger transmembrane domain-containing protein n=1 Tax=Sphaerisporangium melleum TaxID=321316 RepID=A0A917R9M9_9ACTN|nr:cation:proton antiporter [Sphaerisporangium melleum]GGK96005.1 hypothetical protein GCM10007964_42840 [Sphaerisporangium melleum]GII70666.1 hypothetical protein Sme01_31420 [Sphaerisporangium melleum]